MANVRLLLAGAILLAAAVCSAQTDPGGFNSSKTEKERISDLVGIKVVNVYVRTVGESDDNTVSKDVLQALVELKLRQSRIKIQSVDEMVKSILNDKKRNYFVTLRIKTIKKEDLYSVNIELQVETYGVAPNNPTAGPNASIVLWGEDSLCVFGKGIVNSSIKQVVDESLTRLCNDFLAANPGSNLPTRAAVVAGPRRTDHAL